MTQHCPHWNAEMAAGVLRRHMARCPKRPEIAERIQTLMRSLAIDGRAPTIWIYDEETRASDLPSKNLIRRTFGTWAKFCHWCGLKPPLRRWEGAELAPDPTCMEGNIMADDTRWHDPSALQCVPVRIPVRAWDPQQHRYVTVALQEAWRIW